jgi:trimeric autotransporter adhesin
MSRKNVLLSLLVLGLATLSPAQNAQTSLATVTVPRMVQYSGVLKINQSTLAGRVAGVTFALYKEQEGGAPLWIETQNVTLDARGNYTVSLGSSKADGLPADLFSSGEARWLGVTVSGETEQPRVLLLSVPYALKAADAETIGGLPPSAFMQAGSPTMAPVASGSTATGFTSSPMAPPPATITGSGTTNFLPLWTGTTTQGNSAVFQSGTGASAKVGINTNTPATTLDVNGASTMRGAVTLSATSAATASAGKSSQPQNLVASAFNSTSSTAVNQTFRWQAEPTANNTISASGTLNLLFGKGTATPAETGLKIANNGRITFAPGQTFPGGGGSVTSVGLSAPSSDFTVSGSPVTKSGTLALNWIAPPASASQANTIVKRDGSGSFTAGTVNALAIVANNASGGVGVIANSSSSAGVFGGSNTNAGVWGTSVSGHGVFGETNGAGSAFGVFGLNNAINGVGVYGATTGSTGVGVSGFGNIGVQGISASIDGSGAGVYAQGRVGSSGLYAVSDDLGWGVNAYNVGSGTGVLAGSASGFAAWFNGEVEVDGNLHKEGGSFKIDHPLDPANKYLYHSFVESPDMMNIYNGNVTTNAAGEAIVTLPEWFETLNRDFRYQLTVMGQFAQAIVASKVANHRFSIKSDKPNVEVSWQVSGIRQDAWANAHRIPVEEQKSAKERGSYLNPELFGAPEEKGVLWARDPQTMMQWKQTRMKLASHTQK